MRSNETSKVIKPEEIKRENVRKKVFNISKIKKNNLKKKKEIQEYLHSNEFITPHNKAKVLKQENSGTNESFSNEEIENSTTYPNSLISISKDVGEYLKEKGLVQTKYLNERVISKINNSEKISEKNIQRRVYDAINVMNAIGLINKEKGCLQYLGENGFRKNNLENVRPGEKISEEIFKKEIDINQKLQELLIIYTKVKLIKKF